jgi:phage repressor protein C with HTH and peptisase S24 domain
MESDDLTTRGARIRFIRERLLRLDSQDDLASVLKVTRGAVGNWELNKDIGRKNLVALAKLANVSVEWIEDRQGPDPEEVTEAREVINPQGEKISVREGGIHEIDSRAGLGGGQHVPEAYEATDEGWKVVDAMKPEPWILPPTFVRNGFRAPLSKIIAMTTQGESMSPTINHGDVVFIDTSHQRISPPGLYAMRDVYGEIIVKRLEAFREKGEPMVRIESDNPSHGERFERIADIHIVGRICGMMKLV